MVAHRPTAELALLLHMHQPLYTDPATGVAALPWTRLHGARSYLDLAWLLDEYEHVRLTVNFVPSLVAQLEAVVAGARDAYLDVAERLEWTPEERTFLVARFFSIHWGRAVEPRPRYRELLDKRGREVPPGQLAGRAATFTPQDLRDLTVLFHLAWLGFAVRAGDRDLAALEAKGRGYDAQDLALVVERGRAACARVLPLYRKLGERGQVELIASPYYHPIVPLLCDSDAARRAMPAARLPDRFSFPEDARAQIARGRAAHAATFGAPPTGMWPPEGSVSPEALAAYRAEGVRWLATDEGNLWRSLDGARPRGVLYQPWSHDGVGLVFRDREMSDRIGFSYAFGEARPSVDDLIGRARHAAVLAAEAGATAGGAPALVPVVLDGENPWEAYAGQGEPFLRALFDTLRWTDDVRSATVGGHLAAHPPRATLGRLHSGSWIDSDFHIWIADPIKNRAWDLLCRARERYERVAAAQPAVADGTGGSAARPAEGGAGAPRAEAGASSVRLEAALEHLLAAEGSDWFWWFGEPFHSAEDEIFDRLFRAHVAAALRALGEAPFAELDQPVSGRVTGPLSRPPRAFIHPRIDGHAPSYFEWHDAGRFDVPRGAAMAQTPLAETVYFGFDQETLFFRIDPARDAAARLAAATVEIALRRGEEDVTLVARPGAAALEVSLSAREGRPPEPASPMAASARAVGAQARGAILEVAVPFATLGLTAGESLQLTVRVLDGGVQVARYPLDGSLPLTVPDEAFEADNWSV